MKGLLLRAFETGNILEMIYQSEKGILTQRRIRILEMNNDKIRAYCFLRRKQRSFKISNILSIGPVCQYKKGA